jgi:glycosyltransferase involved in cell wall biosynthesis
MNKRRLVYVLHNIESGGVEVALLDSLNQLSLNFDVFIYIIGRVKSIELKQILNNFNYFEQKSLNFFLLHRIFIGMYRLYQYKPHYIIYSLWRSYFLFLIHKIFLSKKIAKICFYHNDKYFNNLDAIFSKASLKFANYIFVDSQSTRKFVEKNIQVQKNIFEINMLSGEIFNFEFEFKKLLNYNFNFLFAGRLSKTKRVIEIINLFHKLKIKDNVLTLYIYGRDDGELFSIINYLKSKGINNVIIKGEYNKSLQVDHFRDIHFIFNYSLNEGYAMTIAEAMHQGIVPLVLPSGEIINYSINNVNSIHLSGDIDSDAELLNSFLLNLSKNPKTFEILSSNASKTFITSYKYPESLTIALNNLKNI